jgi:hypothetical protein
VAKRRNRRQPIDRPEIRVYFEGDESLRLGFKAFFREIVELAESKRWRLEFVATGGTPVPDFRIALKTHLKAWNILLLDSDGLVTGALFGEKCGSQGLKRSDSDSVFWMVQIMESWFLADAEQLQEYYGQKFKRSAVGSIPDVEQIPKKRVYAKLKSRNQRMSDGRVS